MKPKRLIFFHPDLGIGGAERLVIDAAVALQGLGHKVTIFTSHCDPNHCFDEARDGTLDVRVRGNTLFPATVLGRFKILFAVLRQIHLILFIKFTKELDRLNPEAFFVDQLSAGVPLMRYWYPDTRILFYCHFPDLLLVQGRKSWVKRIWRVGFDTLEGWGMRCADRVVVNSEFTKGVVEQVWKGLGRERGIGVVYPCVDTKGKSNDIVNGHQKPLWKGKKVVLSINRFERKKDVGLALAAFAGLQFKTGSRLVIAGGYDSRERENVECHEELVSLAEGLGLQAATAKNIVSASSIPDSIDVLFLLSVPTSMKYNLLDSAELLIYTPSNEHFGIVPLEAMLAGVPVLAANSGGPLETVLEAETGWLRPFDKIDQWTEVMHQVLDILPEERLKKMGEAGKQHVKAAFSERKLAARLDEEIAAMISEPRQQVTELAEVLLFVAVTTMGLVVICTVIKNVI